MFLLAERFLIVSSQTSMEINKVSQEREHPYDIRTNCVLAIIVYIYQTQDYYFVKNHGNPAILILLLF